MRLAAAASKNLQSLENKTLRYYFEADADRAREEWGSSQTNCSTICDGSTGGGGSITEEAEVRNSKALASSNAAIERENEELVEQAEVLRRRKIEFTSTVSKLDGAILELQQQEQVLICNQLIVVSRVSFLVFCR